VEGHEFTRANKRLEIPGALAPEGGELPLDSPPGEA
jgi:hypothetical protein